LPSSPVIPFDDPTIMFANAGMNQFKDIFTGQKRPEHPRATTSQKCMRAGGKHNDLENVGRTGRHHTFFEMLGNFSFGDYFKEKAIVYCWEWVTKYLELPRDRLYATVYEEDDEAFALWAKIAPELKNGRILKFGKKDNYWSMGNIGPCGPCSEVHFDRGAKFGTGPEDKVNGEGERYVEIWNLVFMQYEQKPDGSVVPLPKPSVDTGAGLERVTCVTNELDSNYETDLFTPLIEHITDITGKKYYTDTRGVSHRVVADHVRALTFCIADGGGLSNEKQGYVLRRILRRAARHGRLMDRHEPFIYKLVPTLVNMMGGIYPEIRNRQEHIVKVIKAEEESFGRTLNVGCELFDEVAAGMKKTGGTVISGEDIFKLYDTYGFPVDLINVMAEEKGLTLDMAAFEQAMNHQKEQSRGAAQFDHIVEGLKPVIDYLQNNADLYKGGTKFVRDRFSVKTQIIQFDQLPYPDVAVITKESPFYVESGGQIGDRGSVKIQEAELTIEIDKVFNYQGIIIHRGTAQSKNHNKLDAKKLIGAEAIVSIDTSRRFDIMRNHTATHLLHAALRKVLGEHVYQSGSYVGPDKLRFDFSHFEPMTDEQITQVEKIVNERILGAETVATQVDMDIEQAKKEGAMAIFGEKYDSKVRVVSISDFSKELCGGTHVENTAQIGPFMITLETGIASGVRRIEAVTGRMAIEKMLADKQTINHATRLLNKPEDEISKAIEETGRKILDLQKEIKKLKAEKFSSGGGTTVGQDKTIGRVIFKFHDFGEVDPVEMSGWVDNIKGSAKAEIAAAVGKVDGKITFMSSASASAGVNIGKLTGEVLKELGGRGGGKENFARGSVPDTVTSDAVFELLHHKLRDMLE